MSWRGSLPHSSLLYRILDPKIGHVDDTALIGRSPLQRRLRSHCLLLVQFLIHQLLHQMALIAVPYHPFALFELDRLHLVLYVLRLRLSLALDYYYLL